MFINDTKPRIGCVVPPQSSSSDINLNINGIVFYEPVSSWQIIGGLSSKLFKLLFP